MWIPTSSTIQNYFFMKIVIKIFMPLLLVQEEKNFHQDNISKRKESLKGLPRSSVVTMTECPYMTLTV